MKHWLFSLIFLPFGLEAFTEEAFLKQAQKLSSPANKNIDLANASSDFQKRSFQDQFSWSTTAQAGHVSDVQPILDPTAVRLHPVNSLKFGVQKNSMKGMRFNTSVGLTQLNASGNGFSFQDLKSTEIGIGFQMDLYKNFLGALTESHFEVISKNAEATQAKTFQDKAQFYNSLRKIYWALAFNLKKQDVTKGLLATSKKQHAFVKRQSQSGVADAGNVAQMLAQVSRQEGALTQLEYEEIILRNQLGELSPGIDSQFQPKVNEKQTLQEFMICVGYLDKQDGPDLKSTYIDDMVIKTKEAMAADIRVADKTDSADLQLSYEVTNNAFHESSFGDSFSEGLENEQNKQTIGLLLTIPLGDQSKTKEAHVRMKKLQYEAQVQSLETKLKQQHEFARRTTKSLLKVVQIQERGSGALKKRLKIEERKFRQARTTLLSITTDQDSLLQSEMTMIGAQNQIVNILLDYFSTFPQTPCAFNKLKGAL